jgi:hypothetical protein
MAKYSERLFVRAPANARKPAYVRAPLHHSNTGKKLKALEQIFLLGQLIIITKCKTKVTYEGGSKILHLMNKVADLERRSGMKPSASTKAAAEIILDWEGSVASALC